MVSTALIVVGVILVILVLWVVITYNSLISLRNTVKQAFSGIDVQLKRRFDLIPNLVNTVKGYAKHEKELMENLTKARTSFLNVGQDVSKMAKSDGELNGLLKSLFAVAENYPNLKANENFKQLQEELAETEDQIAASRRIYNENVNYMNTKIESVPSNIIAGMFNFKKWDSFEASVEEKKEIKVGF